VAISLTNISRGQQVLPPRIVIYGPHGVGKTTFGAGAPKPILLPLEDGAGMLDIPRFPQLKTYGEVTEAITALHDEASDFQTLVVDSLDWLQPLVWAETCLRNKWDDIEKPGYGKGYIAADDIWRELFSGFVSLRETKNMAVILLAHCEVKTFQDPSADPYDRYQIKLQTRAAAIVQEWADMVGFATFKVYTTEKTGAFNKKVTRGIGQGERVLYTEERPSHYAKNRYALPYELPLAYPALQNAIFNRAPNASAA